MGDRRDGRGQRRGCGVARLYGRAGDRPRRALAAGLPRARLRERRSHRHLPEERRAMGGDRPGGPGHGTGRGAPVCDRQCREHRLVRRQLRCPPPGAGHRQGPAPPARTHALAAARRLHRGARRCGSGRTPVTSRAGRHRRHVPAGVCAAVRSPCAGTRHAGDHRLHLRHHRQAQGREAVPCQHPRQCRGQFEGDRVARHGHLAVRAADVAHVRAHLRLLPDAVRRRVRRLLARHPADRRRPCRREAHPAGRRAPPVRTLPCAHRAGGRRLSGETHPVQDDRALRLEGVPGRGEPVRAPRLCTAAAIGSGADPRQAGRPAATGRRWRRQAGTAHRADLHRPWPEDDPGLRHDRGLSGDRRQPGGRQRPEFGRPVARRSRVADLRRRRTAGARPLGDAGLLAQPGSHRQGAFARGLAQHRRHRRDPERKDLHPWPLEGHHRAVQRREVPARGGRGRTARRTGVRAGDAGR